MAEITATIEYRVCWSASSNASFRGATDWREWDDDEATKDDIEDVLTGGATRLSDGLEEALEASGFDWWVETRDAGDV